MAAASLRAFSQPIPTIRTETRVVQITVEARGANGRPVAGLTKDDFVVLDSGKPRAIDIFSVEPDGGVRPAEAAAPAPPAKVFSNRGPAAPPRHCTVILFDGINNYWDDFTAARLRLLSALNKIVTEERIAVYATLPRPPGIVLIQDFTTDRARLRQTIDAYRPPLTRVAPGMVGGERPAPPGEENLRRRNAILDTTEVFRLLASHLRKLPGRKSILWLTSGLPPQQFIAMPVPLAAAVNDLNEANVAVNTIDDDGFAHSKRRWGVAAASMLPDLSKRTGGVAFLGRNDLDHMLAEAIDAPRTVYVLGFYLRDAELDGTFHPLAVSVKRPEVHLSHRRSYFSGDAPPPATRNREPLENALLNPLDASEIGISAQVAVAPGSPRKVLNLTIRVELAGISLTEEAGWSSGKLEAAFLETDATGEVVAKVSFTKDFRVTERVRREIEVQGIPLSQELGLMEDASRLLIVIRDAASGKTGSLSIPLEK